MLTAMEIAFFNAVAAGRPSFSYEGQTYSVSTYSADRLRQQESEAIVLQPLSGWVIVNGQRYVVIHSPGARSGEPGYSSIYCNDEYVSTHRAGANVTDVIRRHAFSEDRPQLDDTVGVFDPSVAPKE